MDTKEYRAFVLANDNPLFVSTRIEGEIRTRSPSLTPRALTEQPSPPVLVSAIICCAVSRASHWSHHWWQVHLCISHAVNSVFIFLCRNVSGPWLFGSRQQATKWICYSERKQNIFKFILLGMKKDFTEIH